MTTLAPGIQKIGFYIGATPFVLTDSVFAVGTTKIHTTSASGNPVTWRNGSAFNNLNGLNRDEILPYSVVIVNPSDAIVTDDNLFSFGTLVPSIKNYFGKAFG